MVALDAERFQQNIEKGAKGAAAEGRQFVAGLPLGKQVGPRRLLRFSSPSRPAAGPGDGGRGERCEQGRDDSARDGTIVAGPSGPARRNVRSVCGRQRQCRAPRG